MTRPACAADIMARLSPLVKSGLVARADAVLAITTFDAELWADGVVTVRDGKAWYRTGKTEKPEAIRAPVWVPGKKEKKVKEVKREETPVLFAEKQVRPGKWVPAEGDIF